MDNIQTVRNQYQELKDKHFVDPHKEDANPEINNPLSTEDGSTWAVYFENKELQQEIERDVARTFPENEFFREKEIQKMMTNILFVYAKEHPNLAYRQGMHEILAPIVHMLHKERTQSCSIQSTLESADCEVSKLLTFVLDKEFIEDDSFGIFDSIMRKIGIWFMSTLESGMERKKTVDLDGMQKPNESPIVTKCRYIQENLLKKHDEQLYSALTKNCIEPQLYLLRWIRILFGREFHMEDSMVVWDAIFSYDQSFGLVDYIAVAMLIFIRTQLLERDFAGCIKRLQKYPPVEDITVLIEHAIAISKSVVYINKKSVPSTPNRYEDHRINSKTYPSTQVRSPPHKPLVNMPKRNKHESTPRKSIPQPSLEPQSRVKQPEVPVVVEPTPSKPRRRPVEKPLGERANTLKRNQELIGEQINALVDYLRKNLTKHPDSKLSNPMIQTIAELKRIRDILNGLIEGNVISPLPEDEILNDALLYIPEPIQTVVKSEVPKPEEHPIEIGTAESSFSQKIKEIEKENESRPGESLSSIFDDPHGLFSDK